MQKVELQSVIMLSVVMAIRMLGLFMILPIFSVAAKHLTGATPFWIGATLGIYGLAQAIFQAPLGILSDYLGRKRVIFGGLVIFIIGSLIAALSHTITGVLLGRMMQGAGAIGSVVLASIADLTQEKNRTQAMAIVGLFIGTSFAVAFLLGPLINLWFHLQGIFWLCALFASLALVWLMFLIPDIPITPPKKKAGVSIFLLFGNTQLLRLNFGIFILHTILTAFFIAIPILLVDELKITLTEQLSLYAIIFLSAFCCVIPLIRMAEKQHRTKSVFIICVGLVTAVPAILMESPTFYLTSIALFLFFCGFTFLEASLPSWLSKIVPPETKGSAMGIYSSSQFLGIFFGGISGGYLLQHFHLQGILLFCCLLGLLWWATTLSLHAPQKLLPTTNCAKE